MTTRLEEHCEFLYRLALAHRKADFIKLVTQANNEEIKAIVELLINFNGENNIANIRSPLVLNSRRTILAKWSIIRSIIQKIFIDLLTIEFSLLILNAGLNEY